MQKANIQRVFESYSGCLSHKKVQSARRRFNRDEDEDDILPLNAFHVDAELKLASSKAVRRHADRTQVVTTPLNEHVRTRITHAGEVTAIGTTIASVLGLNVELVRAIALGHDIGHPPFGHSGEAFLNQASKKTFLHEIFGVVIAQHVERDGCGLNLTHETLSGIIRDAWPAKVKERIVMSEEAKVVMWADRFAYLTADFNDMLRIEYHIPDELNKLMRALGHTQRQRVYHLIGSLVEETAQNGCVLFEKSETAQQFANIRTLMYKHYPILNTSNSTEVLEKMYSFIQKLFPDIDPVLILALMTDKDVLFLAKQPMLDYSCFRQTTVSELIPTLRKKEIRWWDTDLDW